MTQDERKVIELALDLATMHHTDAGYDEFRLKVRQLGKEALAQPEQKPVAYTNGTDVILAKHWTADYPPEGWEPLGYTTPPQRKPLTSQERDAKRWRFLMENSYDSESVTQFHVWEHSWEPHSQTGEPTEWKQRVRGIALIDFIDRAIEAAHGIKE